MSRGFITKIWGPHLWLSLHTITFGYPDNPNMDEKNNYYQFFKSLAFVLPCKYCRDSYTHFINTEPTVLTMQIFDERNKLTKWLYDLHNRVNDKLNVKYNVTYEDVVEKYESFQAQCTATKTGCIMPLNKKYIAYQIADKKNYPIIPYRIALALKEYAKERNIDFDKIEYYNNLIKSNINNKNKNKNNKDEWDKRNYECEKIINFMKKNSISNLEIDGEFKGLPTIEELKLISKLCSNLNESELFQITKKLNRITYSYYKLTI